MQRIALFGGSFDPVHLGHLLVAVTAREELGLARLFFIPAAQSPFKPERQPTPAAQRLRLLRLALAGWNWCEIDEQEVARGGISYTIDTLRQYRQRFPEVHLAVRRTFSRDIPTELLNYRLDLGVASFVPQEPQLASVKIFRDELALVVSPRHRLAKRGRAGLNELGNENFVAHIVESPFRQRVIQLFAKHRVPLRMNIELPTIESIKRFVQMDIGVAIVPRMCVRFEVEQGLLVEVKVRELRMPRDLYLLYRRREPLSHSAKAMFELLKPRSAPSDRDAGSAHESVDS